MPDVVHDQTIDLAQFARDYGVTPDGNAWMLIDVLFERCELRGPAVILVNGPNEMKDCTFTGNAKSCFWHLDPEQNEFVGAIALSGTVFQDCVFRGVGAIGRRETIDLMRQVFTT